MRNIQIFAGFLTFLSLAGLGFYSYAEEAPVDQNIHVDAAKVPWQKVSRPPFPEGLERRTLHLNERIQGGTSILKIPKGYIEPRHYHTTGGHSVYILKGKLKSGGEIVGPGHFFYAPPNVPHGPNEALEETEILLWTDGPLDLFLGDPPAEKDE